MSINGYINKIAKKKAAFEYFLCCLVEWRKSKFPNTGKSFTKLQLHKLLFLAASVGATQESHKMLDLFNRFYALKFGPVELDIYESMMNDSFPGIKVSGINCQLVTEKNKIENLNPDDKFVIEQSVALLRSKNENYVTMPPFHLVEISHEWTVWQISIALAGLSGSKMERMTTKDIIDSTIKAY